MDNLRSVDLNLLVILDALLEEAHVTRAAARLRLSQPATSSALDRLRYLFKDPLLERGGRGMRLTPVAEALRPALKTALAAVGAVLQAPATDLATVRQTVRLVMADAPAAAMAGALHGRLARTAPGVTLAVLPWRGGADAIDRLARGDVELIASVLPPLDPPFHTCPLLEERYVVAMREGHPATEDLSLARWLAFPHVIVSGSGVTETPVDAALAARGLVRRVAMSVPSFLMMPPLLRCSDLLAMLPSRCVPQDRAGPLVALPPPIPVEGFRLDLAWHDRRDKDIVVRHVAREMVDALRPMPAAG